MLGLVNLFIRCLFDILFKFFLHNYGCRLSLDSCYTHAKKRDKTQKMLKMNAADFIFQIFYRYRNMVNLFGHNECVVEI